MHFSKFTLEPPKSWYKAEEAITKDGRMLEGENSHLPGLELRH
jgi:hypothetical protein